jgi:cytochrome bd-type quinol oxidase subunit 2
VTFADPDSPVERARSILSRTAVVVASVLLAVGVGMSEMHQPGYVGVLESACAILLAVPVLNAIAALLEEIGRRDWPFVWAALLVLALVAYSVVEKVK